MTEARVEARVEATPMGRADLGPTTVAVVIPTFNHARFLGEALTSVIHQTRTADEVIVVDDGSHDDPASVARAFPGVRFVRRANGGLAAARNTGLELVTADKVVFLDADDLLHPTALASGLSAFARVPEAGFVYGAHRRIDGAGKLLVPYSYAAIGPDPYSDFLRCNMVGMHAAVMYDRRRLVQAGAFDEALRRCEDYALYLRLSRAAAVASHASVVADYRWHGSNMSADDLDMLAWVLKVHGQEKSLAFERADTRRAWKAGRRIWRDYYVENSLMSLNEKGWSSAASAIARAAVASPAFTARRLARGVARQAKQGLRRFGTRWPPKLGQVQLGDLGSTRPVSLDFGFDRGTPIDRYYIEAFLERHQGDIHGRALEVGDASYCRRFGGAAITAQDVLHVVHGAAEATIIGDLAQPGVLPDAAFDCMVLTQTLHLIYDMRAAVAQVHRALRVGGVALVTLPGISQLDRGEWNSTWSWAVTPYAARRLFAEFFGEAVEVSVHGNVFAATAFLHGLALEEVERTKLDELDPVYPVVVCVRARKS